MHEDAALALVVGRTRSVQLIKLSFELGDDAPISIVKSFGAPN